MRKEAMENLKHMAEEVMQPLEVRLDDLANIRNPLDEDFVWAYAGIDYTIKAQETRVLPRHLCQHLAKHLTDKILQEQYDVKSTWNDTPLRRKVLSTILISEAEANPEKVPSLEDAQKALDKQIKDENKLNSTQSVPVLAKTKKLKVE